MHDLWSKDAELNFFQSALKIANSGSLFYRMTDGRFVAYYPKEYEEEKETIQSRNSLVGMVNEKFHFVISRLGERRANTLKEDLGLI